MFKRISFLAAIALGAVANTTFSQNTSWGRIDHQGEPWVKNVSRPYTVKHGLEGRHLSLWASHGYYYDQQKGQWRWQRPALFCTTEDLFTQTIVVPYLIPMLENAGAVVFTPRERDWQRNEVIVDNDQATASLTGSVYDESYYRNAWQPSPYKGFAMHKGAYRDGENPFEAGTARMAPTTKSKSKRSEVKYQPNIPEAGQYAVYVSYHTLPQSVNDAHYTVWHKGVPTELRVNQQMGGSTWVYLGTFEFDAGMNDQNCVVVSNLSAAKNGVVTTDAVRFGGGMGNISRGGFTSGMPRCLEAARYYAQWAGMPYDVYSHSLGQNDYADDINVRSFMTNRLCGGSAFAPDSVGLGVPIELSLAVHSDAGHTLTGEGVFGTLSICTTQNGQPTLATGMSREASKELATALLDNTTRDLQFRFGEWTRRKLYDRNYSETRLPIVPSAILETMSHQNFGDMRFGQDPNFRFALARSVYKTLLRYVTSHHGEKAVVQPLTPDYFHIEFTNRKGEIRLSWQGIIEDGEPSSKPTGYILYMAIGNGGFDNGTHLRGTSCTLKLVPGLLYHFRVAATNDGGQSFPGEVLSALYQDPNAPTVAVINGFHRVSGPAISVFGQGFDLYSDPGVTHGRTAGWLGRQVVFDTTKIGIEDSTGLGFSTSELAGRFVAGNDQDHVRTHAEAIAKTGLYNIVSSSAQAVETGEMNLSKCVVADIVLGLERNDGHSVVPYKTFSLPMQYVLKNYTSRGGRLFVSGSYVSSDQTYMEDLQFLRGVLKCNPAGAFKGGSGRVSGLGLQFDYYNYLNEQHYASTQSDILMPVSDQASGTSSQVFPAMVYLDQQTAAAVAYQGADYRSLTMGFPFECIRDRQVQAALMRGILSFLVAN